MRTTPLMGKGIAKIEDWSLIDHGDFTILYGFCTDHSRRQELVHTRIHTSRVVEVNEASGFVETENTIYRLGARAEERPYVGKTDDLPPESQL